MVILQIARGIHEHLPARAMEWQLAVIAVLIGARLFGPDDMVMASRTLSGLANIATERTWAIGLMTVGGIRLAALIINGTFSHTFYGSFSPHIRCLMAFFTCFAWLSLTLGLAQSPVTGLGLIVYPVLLASDMYNVARAAGDAALIDRARKNGG